MRNYLLLFTQLPPFLIYKKNPPIFRNSYFFFHDNLHVTGIRDEESNEFQITKILEEINYIVGFFFYQSVMYIASYLDLVKGPRLQTMLPLFRDVTPLQWEVP